MHYHVVDSSAHPSAVQSCPKKKTKNLRLLKKEEHRVVLDIDKTAVLLHVRKSVPIGLLSSLFYFQSIKGCPILLITLKSLKLL